MNKKAVLGASLVALAFNFYLQAQAALNISSPLTQDRTGHFHSQPLPLRITFLVQAIIIVFEMVFLVQLFQRNGAWSKNSHLLARIFLVLSGLFAFANLFSKNSELRLHALAAIVIGYGFYSLADLNTRPNK